MTAQDFLSANKDRFLDELFDLLRIPSISADPAYKKDVIPRAESVADHLRKAGANRVEVMQTPGYPVVYGERIVDPALPTVLVYGHYDVQPPDPLDLWTSPAFEPVIRKTELHPEGAIFARGACDDKGQMFMHVKALEAMVQSGDQPVNLKFVIEGEEEVGSDHLDDFLEQNKDLLAADVVLVNDMASLPTTSPASPPACAAWVMSRSR